MKSNTALRWMTSYTKRLVVIDAVVIVWAMTGALILRFGSFATDSILVSTDEPYIIVTVIFSITWWLMIGISGARDNRVLGYGYEEYKRIISASFWFFGLIAIVSYTFRLDTARGYVGLALPVGLISLLSARFLLRRYLHVERSSGRSTSRVLIVGGAQSVEHLVKSLRAQPMAGYVPDSVYLPGSALGTGISYSGLPVLGSDPSAKSILKAVMARRPDAVALSSGVPLPPTTIRELGWGLADNQIKMIMAPALTDIAGPRISTQPLAGLPLIHVSTPNLAPSQRWVKRAFDIAGATALISILSPLMLLVAASIRIDSKGPVFFEQKRIGFRGAPFTMHKFRSMTVDAESRLGELHRLSDGNQVMFKLKNDPRITPVGRFIRRYSVDELPQLFNVLSGSMSLVGPRPPLPSEVEQYEAHVRRRLLVRPGLTGLWQVSGRSLLSWEDTVRLDLYYVENWSLAGDLVILLRTMRAVLGRHGAY